MCDGIRVCRRAADCLAEYARIPMLVRVDRILKLKTPGNGLGGMQLVEEEAPRAYLKDLGIYDKPEELPRRFDLSNWAFFMAFDAGTPVGGATVAARTSGVDMLEGREDLCVLWDLRVSGAYQRRGLGSRLFDLAAEWGRAQGFHEMKIESQNTNVPAAHFYAGKGAVLGAMNARAYQKEPELGEEIQLIWYLNLAARP